MPDWVTKASLRGCSSCSKVTSLFIGIGIYSNHVPSQSGKIENASRSNALDPIPNQSSACALYPPFPPFLSTTLRGVQQIPLPRTTLFSCAFFFLFLSRFTAIKLLIEHHTTWSEFAPGFFIFAEPTKLICHSPLQPSDSAANRGPRSNTRKRSREPDDMSSPAALPPSSRM